MVNKKVLGVLILLVMVSILLIGRFSHQAKIREAEIYLSKNTSIHASSSGKELVDTYIAYNQKINMDKGTTGVSYYPCPDGFKCSELFPPDLNFPEDEIVFDNCNKSVSECIEIVKDFLSKSGIDDINSYLDNRKK